MIEFYSLSSYSGTYLKFFRPLSLAVLYIGKGGYWEGKVGVNQGWFPALAITESGERQLEEEYRQGE